MTRLFLFDFDGVLADSLDLYAGAVAQSLKMIGTPIVKDKADYLDLFDGNFYESLEARGVDLVAFGQAAKEVLAGMDYGAMKPFAGLAPVLAVLSEANILAVVSSNGYRTIKAMLESYGYASYFRGIFGSDSGFSKKEKIARALEKYGVSRERTFYVGDTAGDILEARAAGVRSVAAAWGWHDRERLAAVRPDYLVDSPEGLLAIGTASGS